MRLSAFFIRGTRKNGGKKQEKKKKKTKRESERKIIGTRTHIIHILNRIHPSIVRNRIEKKLI